jgi:hypothetical protein
VATCSAKVSSISLFERSSLVKFQESNTEHNFFTLDFIFYERTKFVSFMMRQIHDTNGNATSLPPAQCSLDNEVQLAANASMHAAKLRTI